MLGLAEADHRQAADRPRRTRRHRRRSSSFLERPARFAETARPLHVTQGVKPGTEVMIFAQGQAGIVSGYFVLVRQKQTPAAALPPPASEAEVEPSLLARVSRGLRRPLNTIVGFADLIRSSAFGPIHNPRYLEYARDIKAAGMEIAALVDELDDFVRLQGRPLRARASPTSISCSLLNASVVRVRGQAGAARVLVRSAISERLPRVRIDRAALGQAVLNLLASAIDQTPAGGSVILSAQPERRRQHRHPRPRLRPDQHRSRRALRRLPRRHRSRRHGPQPRPLDRRARADPLAARGQRMRAVGRSGGRHRHAVLAGDPARHWSRGERKQLAVAAWRRSNLVSLDRWPGSLFRSRLERFQPSQGSCGINIS